MSFRYAASVFTVDELTAEAVREAYEESGELAGVVELRRHFPSITDNTDAARYVRTIAGWKPFAPGALAQVKALRRRAQ